MSLTLTNYDRSQAWTNFLKSTELLALDTPQVLVISVPGEGRKGQVDLTLATKWFYEDSMLGSAESRSTLGPFADLELNFALFEVGKDTELKSTLFVAEAFGGVHKSDYWALANRYVSLVKRGARLVLFVSHEAGVTDLALVMDEFPDLFKFVRVEEYKKGASIVPFSHAEILVCEERNIEFA